jgi:NTP pyrophosphatase (non-canonical NTP hydrolase)
MMDQERREKELQEIFEKIQHSYRSLVDNAFMLQEQTLELARTIFESSGQEKSPHIRGDLEKLADRSRSQREELEELLRTTGEAYTKVLEAPSDEHHTAQEAKADLEDATPS